jgi:SAM-dependent methyltransferase
MAGGDTDFVGDIPGNYHRYLGPILFHAFADDLAARIEAKRGMRVLETACGTGIVTQRLAERLRGMGSVVATDLNEAMIAHAQGEMPAGRAPVEWQTADATRLPFPDCSFEAVVCQFGLMFFPDKPAGIREALRVLKPGGRFVFNVWDAMEKNPIQRIAHETAGRFFPDDPPLFYKVPFSLHDPEPTRALLAQAGFAPIEVTPLAKEGASPTAAEAARGLIDGNPIGSAIRERRPEAVDEVRRATAAAVAAELGERPVRVPLRAIVFEARRP